MTFFFFFSSRRRHTRCSRDWSSDVCSSDLITTPLYFVARGGQFLDIGGIPIPASVTSSDRSTYRRAYISALGLVDSATQVLTRAGDLRSEEHTSELQSRLHLVCRLLLEKKN